MRRLLVTCCLFASACAGAVESSKLEDRARRTVPVPICLKPLERHGVSGVVSSLQPDDYWSMILPGYDKSSAAVDASSPDCAGRNVFSRPELLDAESTRSGLIPVKPDDAVITPAPDGMRVVWLRTHRFGGEAAAGPLALVRPREGYAEVYATGIYRGSLTKSRFALERMGPRILVTATDEGCAGITPNQSCETGYTVFLVSAGQLTRAAAFPLDRIDYGSLPGISGSAQYRLTATPVFQERSIRVVEQVVVRDATQGAVRKSDLERVFQLDARGNLVASADSLWTQVFGRGAAAQNPGPPPAQLPPVPPKR